MDALSYDVSMYVLVFFVPDTHLEEVKSALFAKGAGTLGSYEQCSFQARGEGQFKPLAGSNPFIGSEDVVEKVEEWRVEMIVSKEVVKEVVEALLAAHPYETPAYHLYPVLTREDFDGHP
jgi:structural hemagglutinin/hemolysin toxin protein RtxA